MSAVPSVKPLPLMVTSVPRVPLVGLTVSSRRTVYQVFSSVTIVLGCLSGAYLDVVIAVPYRQGDSRCSPKDDLGDTGTLRRQIHWAISASFVRPNQCNFCAIDFNVTRIGTRSWSTPRSGPRNVHGNLGGCNATGNTKVLQVDSDTVGAGEVNIGFQRQTLVGAGRGLSRGLVDFVRPTVAIPTGSSSPQPRLPWSRQGWPQIHRRRNLCRKSPAEGIWTFGCIGCCYLVANARYPALHRIQTSPCCPLERLLRLLPPTQVDGAGNKAESLMAAFPQLSCRLLRTHLVRW